MAPKQAKPVASAVEQKDVPSMQVEKGVEVTVRTPGGATCHVPCSRRRVGVVSVRGVGRRCD
jgi:hypothetical protein